MTKTKTLLNFDGTFEGFLSAAFTAMSENLTRVDWQSDADKAPRLFPECRYVPTDRRKARLLWQALSESGTSDRRLAYFAYLSEQSDLLPSIYEYICLLCNRTGIGNVERRSALRAALTPWAERVGREKRKWESQWSTRPDTESQWRCSLRPTHNILPLLTRHCRQKLGTGPWVIYDSRRKYGFRCRHGVIERFSIPKAAGQPQKTRREAAA